MILQRRLPMDCSEPVKDDIAAARIADILSCMKIQVSAQDVARWSVSCIADEKELEDVEKLLTCIRDKACAGRRQVLSATSRIPQKVRKTFDSFDYSVTTEANREVLESLRTLSFVRTGFNVVLTGDKGTGKTHIAEAIGNLCIDRMMRVSYFTLKELKHKMEKSMKDGAIQSLVSNLSGFDCLIIDEFGFCRLSLEETQILFDILNRRYSSGDVSTVITSNKQPSGWADIFEDSEAAKCMLDRLFDRSICIDFRGPSYRGKHKQVHKISFFSDPMIPGSRI